MSVVNEAIQLPLSQPLRILEEGIGQISPPPNSEGLPCDAWHLGGYGFSVPGEEEMMELIKEKLPRIDFPVRIGSTGYIIWPSKDDLPSAGYTLDETGRTVGVIDGIRFFQRYTRNCMLVSDMGEDGSFFTSLSEDDKRILNEKLMNYNP
jgi:hypothetical protein